MQEMKVLHQGAFGLLPAFCGLPRDGWLRHSAFLVGDHPLPVVFFR